MAFRSLRRAIKLVHAGLIRVGLVPYTRPFGYTVDKWDRTYRQGENDHYGSLAESGRYGVVLGYIALFGQGLRILDIGCGEGIMRRRIPGEAVARYVGMDISKEALARARPADRSEFRFGNFKAVESELYDLVICNEVLYFIDDVDGLLAEIGKALAPGGKLVASITRHRGDFALADKLDAKFRLLDRVTIKSDVHHVKWHVSCHERREAAV
ncbi:MAG: class I SAM-dependent methyltransferase [Sphingomonadaceae bacterium]|nr:class I SAM-dependent methyltransferase [Sphingomonadaceae bacterium]